MHPHNYLALQEHITEYLNRLAALGVAGIRIDASKHMNHWDLGMILQVRHVQQFLIALLP